jgi:hypothetical protein
MLDAFVILIVVAKDLLFAEVPLDANIKDLLFAEVPLDANMLLEKRELFAVKTKIPKE